MIEDLLEKINKCSIEATSDETRIQQKEQNEQYFTPISIASFMSSMFKEVRKNEINILDPGCGTGNLSAAFIAMVCDWKRKPKVINLELFEIDETLSEKLNKNLSELQKLCGDNGITLNFTTRYEDFIIAGLNKVNECNDLFDYIILNPPYRKLYSESNHKRILMECGIDVPNYYAAFLAISYRLLKAKGQLVVILPRSFCSGTYFKSFREDLITQTKIDRIHIFKSRKDLFYDEVLQETIILSLQKKVQKLNDTILITESLKDDFTETKRTHKRFDNVIFPLDSKKIIRIIHTPDKMIVDQMHSLPCTLSKLGISVSTGPIVDFREKPESLRFEYNLWSFPMIYQENFRQGKIEWPIESEKPGLIVEDDKNYKRLRPSGIYVLVKRMTTKEERKRIVAAVFNNKEYSDQKVGFDNKINYYHIAQGGIDDLNLAKGLCLYLNSSLVDFYFRTFSGSTQVNVADLKAIKYPYKEDLIQIGRLFTELPPQEEIDKIIDNYDFKKAI
ncbi:adenine-specific DNA-methyltransferase [Peribacillus simplex]|uniref:site-specific DNA-methyltransferase (adenine-specific) n=1 Tax=Peribacillus simplex TaxID=1478 RepID=A0A9X8R1A5_9BACI|nr:N-6 DNA methylase [Peribacillus simplex]SIQ01125.1 adenine-specific DNA-methyltransferase [Peribacillus simplex]